MQDILSKIVDTERQIQETLRQEKVRLGGWVEKEKKKIDEEIGLKKSALEEEAKILELTIKKEAEEKALSIIEKAKNFASRIENLDREYLKKIVVKYLESLLDSPE